MKNYNTFGVMIDMSRNAVMSIDGLKRFFPLLKKMGYNCVFLYTEDTYEVDGEPYFGYMRGRYSKAELKEIDDLGASMGIEVIPCIQTLAHLTAATRWGKFPTDMGDVLLTDDERSYEFIDHMFSSLSGCFRTKRILKAAGAKVVCGLDDIMNAAKNIAMTFKAQGGQGLSLSKIRPKGSIIGGKFKSDGIVPFMEIFNTVTESVSQGGSRKGALLMSLDVNHPEIETFMTIKSDLKKINKANLSVEIDDEFMHKVEKGDAEANRIFNILCEQACKYAEPGVIFTNRFRNYNLMEFVNSYQIETCNPCGRCCLPQ